VSERRCILSGDKADPAALVRLAIAPDGAVLPDVRNKAPGRGAWIGIDRAALEQAIHKGKLRGALARAFKGEALSVPDDLAAQIEQALARTVQERFGLEARASTLVTGFDRIENAARRGQLHLLLHAADAGQDGCRKLDQAWRVGEGREGEAVAGLVLPLDRATLSMALGRHNVVHIGVTDAAAAKRLGAALDRWQSYRGCANGAPTRAPASAAGASGPDSAAGAGQDQEAVEN
jgi:uncharacterized protein